MTLQETPMMLTPRRKSCLLSKMILTDRLRRLKMQLEPTPRLRLLSQLSLMTPNVLLMLKQKTGAHCFETEEQIESLNSKIAQNEKTIHRLEAELEEISMEYERTHTAATICEKRGNNFEKVVDEWKVKAEDLMSEL